MKRKGLPLSIVSLMSLCSLSSCVELVISDDPVSESIYYLNETSYALEDYELEFDTSSFREAMDAVLVDLDRLTPNGLSNLLDNVNGYANQLETDYYVSMIKHSRNLKNKEFASKQRLFGDLLDEYASWRAGFEKRVASTSLASFYFDGMSREEIDSYISENYPSLPMEYYSWSQRVSEIQEEAKLLDSGRISKYSSLYEEMVELENKMARARGYENYMPYAYKNIYGREYTPEDIASFRSYVKSYIPSLLAKLYSGLPKGVSSNRVAHYINDFNNSTFEDEDTGALEDFAAYCGKLGSSFRGAYHVLSNNGFYCYASEEDSEDGAYTAYLPSEETCGLYFGNRYQNIMTYVHEFGHYHASFSQKRSIESFDLAESQSQGNEMLFLSYLEQQAKSYKVEAISHIVKTNLISSLTSILNATAVDEFEQAVYSNSLGDRSYSDYWDYLNQSYGGFLSSKYWSYVVINSPAYYISYATSLIPALEIYSMAKGDFEKAADTYLDIASHESNFLSSIVSSGLSTPFDEDSFMSISKTIKSIR